MQQAEFMNLLRTIFFIILIYYAFRFLARIFAPILMKRMVNKMQQKAQQQYNHQQNTHSTKAGEGETIIDKKPNTSKQSNNSVGEYVDFEEID